MSDHFFDIMLVWFYFVNVFIVNTNIDLDDFFRIISEKMNTVLSPIITATFLLTARMY